MHKNKTNCDMEALMAVTVYTSGSSGRLSEWTLNGFSGGLVKLKSLDELTKETLKESGRNLNDVGKKALEKNLKAIHDLWNPANERLIKSYDAVIVALNLLFKYDRKDPELVENLKKLNNNTNWEYCLDDTLVERLVIMASTAVQENKKVIDYFKKTYEEAVIRAFTETENSRSFLYGSAPASNCERTGICHCGRDQSPLKRSNCLMSGATLARSPMEDAAHDESFRKSMSSLFA